jgi:hypothetical protein
MRIRTVVGLLFSAFFLYGLYSYLSSYYSVPLIGVYVLGYLARG